MISALYLRVKLYFIKQSELEEGEVLYRSIIKLFYNIELGNYLFTSNFRLEFVFIGLGNRIHG